MQTSETLQKDLQCATCAGQNVYDPAQQCLVCESCGTTTALDTPDDHKAAEEFAYDPATPEADPRTTDNSIVHHCETCGGDVVFVGRSLSERCAYCDGPVVMRWGDQAFQTMALIPFRIAERDAQRNAQKWIKGRLAAPSNLAAIAAKGRVVGLYVPFWTFDSEEAVDYWATYKVRSGKRTSRRSTSGEMHISFDDMLVPASPHVTPLIRDGILHEFDPSRLRPYRPGYLAGFGAEQHHQTVSEGLDANAGDKDILIRNKIKRHVGKSGTRVTSYMTDSTGIHYRRILLPVWILHYEYAGRAKKVVVCGIEGRTYGERPFSMLKLAGYSALLTLATVLLGLAWGAGGLL